MVSFIRLSDFCWQIRLDFLEHLTMSRIKTLEEAGVARGSCIGGAVWCNLGPYGAAQWLGAPGGQDGSQTTQAQAQASNGGMQEMYRKNGNDRRETMQRGIWIFGQKSQKSGKRGVRVYVWFSWRRKLAECEERGRCLVSPTRTFIHHCHSLQDRWLPRAGPI